MPSIERKKIPVTILTGFLGSGKTTLLNHILTTMHGLKLAVIENEFGEVGVDEHLVKQSVYSEEQVIETMNGCICCTVRGDLSKILKKLLIEEKRMFDGIIIETTGMADPAPVAQTFFVDDDITEYTTLDGIITVVDAKHIIPHLKEEKMEGAQNESVEQIAFADRIILNKIDLVTKEELEEVHREIRAINSEAEIIESEHSKVEPKRLLGIEAFRLNKVLEMDPQFLNIDQEHVHDQSVSSCGCTFDEPISLGKLQAWISDLISTKANDLYRYKGVINVVGMDSPYVFQGVHMLFTGNFIENGWSENKPRQTYFCFIGKNIDRDYLVNGFKNCVASKLSYSIGDKVECKVAAGPNGWKEGVIIALWDEGNAYRIKLKNGTQVHCPDEIPQLIKLKQKASNESLKYMEIVNEVEAIKSEGNQYFALQKYILAASQYSKGISVVEKKIKELKQESEQVPQHLTDMFLKVKKNLALCYLRTGQYNEGIKQSAEITKHSDNDSKAYYISGQCYAALQNHSEAVKMLKQAQKHDPESPEIRKALELSLKKLKQ